MQQKLAIITTHPIQYNAPFFKMLADRNNLLIKVFYTWSQTENHKKFDPGFGENIKWDIPLLDGYDFTFVKNISNKPGSHHYNGIDNPTLNNEIENWGANIVLVYGWAFKSHFKAMRYFKNKIPVLFRGDSTMLNNFSIIKLIIRKLWLKYVYNNIDYALYVGKKNKEYFLTNGVSENKLLFMPHAIDNKRFEPSKNNIDNGSKLRESLKIKFNEKVILFAGKLEENKNALLLLNAFQKIKSDNIKLLIVGNGKELETLKNNFGSNGNIIFLNFVNQQQMPALYAASNLFILPSISETWGLTLNEAMAAGKAVIASDGCAGAFDVIEHTENGFVFKNNDELDLLKYIKYFVNNIDAYEKMGIKSLEIISSYNYETDCDALETLLSKFQSI